MRLLLSCGSRSHSFKWERVLRTIHKYSVAVIRDFVKHINNWCWCGDDDIFIAVSNYCVRNMTVLLGAELCNAGSVGPISVLHVGL